MARHLRRISFFLCLIIALSLPFDFLLKEVGIKTPFIKSYQEVLIIVLLLLWELSVIFERRISLIHTSIDYPLFAFFAIHIFSSLFPSTYTIWSLKYTFRVFGFGLLFYGVVNFADSKRRLNLLVMLLLVSGTLAAALAIVQKFFCHGQIGDVVIGVQNFLEDIVERPDKIRGPFLWSSVLACYMASLIPLSVSCLVWSSKSLVKRGLLLLATLTMALALFLSGVNAGVIAAGGGLLVTFMVYLYKRKKRRALSIFVILVVMFVLAFLAFLFNEDTRPCIFKHIPELQTSYDLGLWKTAIKMTVQRPGKGWGADMFYWKYPMFTPSGMPVPFTPNYRSHNIFLEVGSGLGLFGVLALVWLLFSIIKTVGKGLLNTRISPFRWAIQLGALGSLAAFFIHSQVDFFWFVHETLALFWMLVGIGVCGALISDPEDELKK